MEKLTWHGGGAMSGAADWQASCAALTRRWPIDLSIPAYFFLGPGCTLLVLEFLFPPYRAAFANGTVLHLGRSLLLLAPSLPGAKTVSIDWWALSCECFVLVICIAVSYRLLSRSEPLW